MTRGWYEEPTLPAVRIADVRARTPGLALLFASGEPRFCLIEGPAAQKLAAGEPVVVGRSSSADLQLDDSTLSRAHAEVQLRDGEWHVRDTSRHGTFVDGQLAAPEVVSRDPRTLRVGDQLLAFVADVAPYRGQAVALDDDLVLGPATAATIAALDRALGRGGDVLLVGEPGVGKETLLRRALRGGPAIAADCPRGALATDTGRRGLLAAAKHEPLLLEEVGAAGPEAQDALLALLGNRPTPRLVATSTQALELAAPPWLSPALFARFADGVVRVSALRDRWEELSFLVAAEVRRAGRVPTATLIERCLLRPFRDNVRGLLGAVREAVAAASADARRSSADGAERVDGRYLPGPLPAAPPADSALEITDAHALRLDRAATAAALADAGGDVELAAARLRVHKNTLQRHLRKLGL